MLKGPENVFDKQCNSVTESKMHPCFILQMCNGLTLLYQPIFWFNLILRGTYACHKIANHTFPTPIVYLILCLLYTHYLHQILHLPHKQPYTKE